MKLLVKRNLKLFFRDKGAVFFSMLGVIIIFLLYIVFLGDSYINSGDLKNLENSNVLMNSWLVAGLLSVASVTTTMGAFGVMIDDKVRNISKDFNSSPIKSSAITGGYLVSSYLIGVIMSLFTAFVSNFYIVYNGGNWFGLDVWIKILLLVLLTSLTNTSLVCFIVSFFKSNGAFGAASTILGTLIGFLTGIYIPIGSLPSSVQMVIKVFPVSHAASLFRQVLMDAPIKSSFEGIPASYVDEFKEHLGVVFKFGDFEVTTTFNILILVGTAILFYVLAFMNMSRKRRQK